MNAVRHFIQKYISPAKPLTPGVFNYQSPPNITPPLRLHLRIDLDGNGLFIINAHTVLHLNQTAAEYAYHYVSGTAESEIGRIIANRYNINWIQALEDYQTFKSRLETLVNTPDLDPETFLDFGRSEPHSGELTAPYRLDCALTYKTMGEGSEKLAPTDRVRRDLLESEWKTILVKAWAAGIPHVIFTGGEPTLRPDLVNLVAHTQKVGLVSGIITNGLRMAEKDYLHNLLQAGLDHMMIILDPDEDQAWEAIRDTLAEDIYLNVHLTVTAQNLSTMPHLIEKLAKMGVQSLSLSANSSNLKNELQTLSAIVSEHQLKLVWDLPVPYSQFHPVALEMEGQETTISGAGNAWLYVEPDGDVLPAQGINTVLGNFLSDPWEKIWANRQA